MPQLELINWIFNFFMMWSFLVLVFSILIKSSIVYKKVTLINYNPTLPSNNKMWYWI